MLVVFAYNFPHRKTQDFLFFCQHYRIKVDAVIAADFVNLNFPPKRYRSHIRPMGLIHPEELCRSMGIPYFACPHNSEKSLKLIQEMKPELGLVAGARMLSKNVIDGFSKGIVNFHPGPIPEMRGLDTVHWLIYDNVPLGVTAHFVDSRVDAGRIIKWHPLPLFLDDTMIDVSLRLYEGQLEIFQEALELAQRHPLQYFPEVPLDCKKSYKDFPIEREEELHERFEEYLSLNAESKRQDARDWYSGKRMVKVYRPFTE